MRGILQTGLQIAILSVLFAGALWTSETASIFPLVLEHKMSTVYLLGVEQPPREELEAEEPSAPDALSFFVIVARMPGADGVFTLTETRDFQIDGSSYRSRTESEVGKVFEPHTIVDDISDFFALRPHLPRPALANDSAVAIEVLIFGSRIPPSSRIEVTFKVGWDQEVEPFSFAVMSPP